MGAAANYRFKLESTFCKIEQKHFGHISFSFSVAREVSARHYLSLRQLHACVRHTKNGNEI